MVGGLQMIWSKRAALEPAIGSGGLEERKPTKRGSAFSALPEREIRQFRFQRLGRDDLMAEVRETGVMINGRSEGSLATSFELVEVRLPESFALTGSAGAGAHLEAARESRGSLRPARSIRAV
jgi:hypothetical protein